MTLAETILGPTERLIEQWSGSNETQTLDGVRDVVERAGAWCAVFPVVAGEPNQVVLREANELNAGMIAMGTRGLGPVSGLLAGSVALHVLQHARVPVLLAR
jgi:nucleotide-binding universal stress UspA family protein